jgi:GGDEF domain-containing protein
MFEASDQNSQKCIKKTARLRLPIWEEEFSVILPETDEEKARRVAEKIRIAIEKLEISHASSKISQWSLSVWILQRWFQRSIPHL